MNLSEPSIGLDWTPRTVKHCSHCIFKSQHTGTNRPWTGCSRMITRSILWRCRAPKSLCIFDPWKFRRLDSYLQVEQTADILHPFCDVDQYHASELEVSFGDHGIDYSRGLILVTAVLSVEEAFSAINISCPEDGRRTLLQGSQIGAVSIRHSRNVLVGFGESHILAVDCAKGRLGWATSSITMTCCFTGAR